jgi:ATP-dependent DNA helicase RecQ
VENLRKKEIKALAITSGMSKREIDIALDNCIYGNYKFLYLSPERLGNELARTRIAAMKVCLIAVDEAHCISQWGYDFRPSYLKIAELRELVKAPVLALTATAQEDVIKDIQKNLLFKKEQVMKKSFERKNLAYVVLQEEDKLNRLLKITRNIKGTGIVYVRNRRKTEEIAHFLNRNNCPADFYHAGMPSAERNNKQNNWINNQTRIMVCTNAFGMGIDKADVRFVVHLDLPDCIEAYFQEAGRAGRDEKKAYAVLLYGKPDMLDLEQRFELSFPSIEEIKRTYQALGNYYQLAVESGLDASYDFDIHAFCTTYSLTANTVFNCLKLLEKEQYISISEELNLPSRIKFNVNNADLYTFQVAHKKYDEFIKLLLRSYSGTFDNYVKINESELAKRCNISREEVILHLGKLDGLGILSYLPQKNLPQVTYTQARVDTKYLRINKENLAERKQKMRERIDAIVAYASEKNTCRNILLLRYFGETEARECGHCDVCIDKRKKELNNDEFEKISSNILHVLQLKPHPLYDLIIHSGSKSEDAVIKTIQLMLDDDLIVYNDKNELELKK